MSKERELKQKAFAGANQVYKHRQDQVGRHLHEPDMASRGVGERVMNMGFRKGEEMRRARAAKDLEAYRNPKTLAQKAQRKTDDLAKGAWQGLKKATGGRPKADNPDPFAKPPKGAPSRAFADGAGGMARHGGAGGAHGFQGPRQPGQDMGPRPPGMFEHPGSGPGVQMQRQPKKNGAPPSQGLPHQESGTEVKMQRQSKPAMERHDSAGSVDFHTPMQSTFA